MAAYYLAYDPASYSAGAALFCKERGLIAWTGIMGKRDDPLPVRLKDQYTQLVSFVEQHINPWDYLTVLVENICAIPGQQLILAVSAALPLMLPHVKYYSSIQISSWKKWLVDSGVPKERCKGKPALSLVRPELVAAGMSDDVADAVIFGLYYLDKKGQVLDGKPVQAVRRKRTPAKKSPKRSAKLA